MALCTNLNYILQPLLEMSPNDSKLQRSSWGHQSFCLSYSKNAYKGKKKVVRMDASRGTPISFTLPELFNALGGFRAWSIERRREPFFPPKLRSYIPRHAWWWASCMLRSFLHKKINQQNEKRVQLGTVVSWVLRPSETNTISKCPSATKSLQTWGLVCHYNIFRQPLGIIESILIRGKPLFFVTSFLVLEKTTCFFFHFGITRNRARRKVMEGAEKSILLKNTSSCEGFFYYSQLLRLDLQKIGQL